MNKKFKYTSLVAAGAITLGLVGGTLAWFTSQADVTNVFKTGRVSSDNNTDGIPGIEVNEAFNSPTNMLPGDVVDKEVQVTNTASYNQFVRVHFEVQIKDANGTLKSSEKIIEQDGKYVVDNYEDIELIFESFASGMMDDQGDVETDTDGKVIGESKWFPLTNDTDNTIDFYYIGMVKAQSGTAVNGNYTSTLLKDVKLNNNADNTSQVSNYANLQIDLKVVADSIQATNGAYAEWCDASLVSVYSFLENRKDEQDNVIVTEPTHSYAGQIVSGIKQSQ